MEITIRAISGGLVKVEDGLGVGMIKMWYNNSACTILCSSVQASI